MPFLLVLGPIFGVAVLVAVVAHAHKNSAAQLAQTAQTARHIELDQGMPESVVQRVLGALLHEEDPAKLETLAHELSANYPIASGEVRAKSATFGGKPHAETAPPPPSPPATGHGEVPPSPSPAPTAPDVGEAALILQGAMKAFAHETDPVELEGFAASIRARYPTATLLLLGRARELRAASTPAAVSPHPSAAPHPEALPVSPHIYLVQEGDTPALIAQKLAHDGGRWPELVALNPGKPTTADGHFASLRPGETLHVPPSWSPLAPSPHQQPHAPKEVHP